MTPAEFRALGCPLAPANPRRYRALTETGAAETFLTLHLPDSKCHSLAYAQLSLMSADEHGGTLIRLVFRTHTVVIWGERLQATIEAIRARRASHLHGFDAGRYDLPEPDAAMVKEIKFEVQRPRPADGAAPSAAA